MEELYELINEVDSTVLDGISMEEFNAAFSDRNGMAELYSALAQSPKTTSVLKDISQDEFISAFSAGPAVVDLSDLGANESFPAITADQKPYQALEKALAPVEDDIANVRGNFFDQVGEIAYDIGASAIDFFKGASLFGGAKARGQKRRETQEASLQEFTTLQNEIAANVPVEAITPISYGEVYSDITATSGNDSKRQDILSTNKKLKEHTARLQVIEQAKFDKLKDNEKKAAIAARQGQNITIDNPSSDFNEWSVAFDALRGQEAENNTNIDQYKDILEDVFTIIGEGKNKDLDEGIIADLVVQELELKKKDNPEQADRISDIIKLVNEESMTGTDNPVTSGIINTIGNLVEGADALGQFAEHFGAKVLNMFRGKDTDITDENIKEEVLRGSRRQIFRAFADAGSKYNGALQERRVNIGDRNLVVDYKGDVKYIRREDGTLVLRPTASDIEKVREYQSNPDKYKEEQKFRTGAFLSQGWQVITDMIPMITIASASGGSTLGIVKGTAAVMYGDLYNQVLEETSDIEISSLWAGVTAPLIGFFEAKIGPLESKLARTISAAEKRELFKIIHKTTAEATEKGVTEFVAGPGIMNRLHKAISNTITLASDIKGEILEEISNYPAEALTRGALSLNKQYISPDEWHTTFALTTLASGIMGGANIALSKNIRHLQELYGIAANNIEEFEKVSQEWVEAAPNTKEKQKRANDILAKKAAITEIADVLDFIEENDVSDKKADTLSDLATEKAILETQKASARSQRTQRKLADRISDIDRQIDTEIREVEDNIVAPGTDATATDGATSEGASSPSKQTFASRFTYADSKDLAGKRVTIQALDPKSGKQIETELPAVEAQKVVRQEVDKLSKLKDCLGI